MSAEREWRHEWKERPIEQLRDVLSMLCNYIWTKQLRPGEHLWSIPVDQERDFDCILHDAVNELEERRKAAGGTDAPPPAPSFICNCGTTMVCPDIGCDKNKVAADAPPLAEPDLAGDLAAWKDWQAAGKPRADAPPPARRIEIHPERARQIAANYAREFPADAPPPALDVEAMRANLHATFNGGWRMTKDTLEAFHHGMDTVCNVLAAQQKGEGTNGVLPVADAPPPGAPLEKLDDACHCGAYPEGGMVWGTRCPIIEHRARSGAQWRADYLELHAENLRLREQLAADALPALRALVAQWREMAAWESENQNAEHAAALDYCADALEKQIGLRPRSPREEK